MYSTRTFAATFAMLSCAIAQIAATDQSLKDLAASKGDEDLVAWDPTADPFIGPHIKELLSGKGCGVLHIFSNAAVRKQAAEDDGFESPWPFADNGMAPICYDGYDYKFGDIATYSTYESNKDSIYILYGHIPQDQNEDSVVVAGSATLVGLSSVAEMEQEMSKCDDVCETRAKRRLSL